MTLQTYGKTRIRKEISDFKNKIFLNPHLKKYWKSRGLEIYNPAINRKRLGISGVLIVGCLLTFGTSWAIPIIAKWGLK